MELKDAVVIVTGGSKGYGFGMAEALIAKGAEVWITGRDEAALQAAAGRIGAKAVRADASSGADWDKLMEAVLKSKGQLDLLINNAGAGVAIAPVQDQSDDAIISSISVNLTGAILGCKRAAQIMTRQKSGMIINISSVCALYAWPGWSVYTAAKAGLSKFGHGLYTELRPFGVRVTTITPSWGTTEFAKVLNLPEHDAATQAKCMSPEQMGELVVKLYAMPEFLVVPDITVQPMIQEIIPM
jgi:NADP-dependent 3-hydroxy acid dehydrogenase YdfG